MKRFLITFLLLFKCSLLFLQIQTYNCGLEEITIGGEPSNFSPNSCFSTSVANHDFDFNYIPGNNDFRIDVRLKFIVFQKSENEPRNFVDGNPEHYNYLNGAYWTARGVFEDVKAPYYQGAENPSGFQTINNTRIRFIREGDIEYVTNEQLWNNGGNNSFCGRTDTDLWIDYLKSRSDNECVLYVLLPGMMNPSADGCGNAYYGENYNFIVIPGWSHFNQPLSLRWANWQEGRNIAHELGHALGMHHTFGTDASAFADVDYPTDACWCNPETNLGNSSCPSPLSCSNNLMSYSAHFNEHISPLQTGHMRELVFSTWRSKWMKIDKDESSDIIIEPGTSITWDQARVVERDIIVKPGAELTVNCKLVFSEGVEINVEPNGRLILDGAYLTTQHSNCGSRYFWKGIDALGIPSASQNQNNQSYIELRNGTIIENAQDGISTGDNGNAAYSGAIINAVNSIFRNNNRHVEFLEYSQTNTSYFEGCSFLFDEDFFPSNTSSKYGVTIYKNEGITFRDCEFISDYYNDNYRGIFALSSGFEVVGFNNRFSGFWIGVQCQNNSGNSLVVENTIFENNAIGLSVSNTIGGRFKNNTFIIGGNPLRRKPSGTWLTYNHGFHLLNSSGYDVENNNFIKLGTASGNVGTYGVLIKNSGENFNIVADNYFESLKIGVQCEGVNRVLGDSQEGLEFHCNSFKNCQKAIFVTPVDGPVVLDQQGGIALSQGRLENATGNIFPLSIEAINNYYASSIDYYYDNTSNSFPVNSQNVNEIIGEGSVCNEGVSSTYNENVTNSNASYEDTKEIIDSFIFSRQFFEASVKLAELNSIESNNAFNKYLDYKALKDIELSFSDFENFGDLSMNSVDINTIVNIADNDFSDAAIEARSLLSFFFNEEYAVGYFTILDENIEDLRLSESRISMETKIYPNPSKGSFFIEAPENIARVDIFRQDGESVMNLVNYGKSVFEFAIENVGIYWVRVLFENQEEPVLKKIIKAD